MLIPKKNRKIVYQYLFRGACKARRDHEKIKQTNET
jgi:hypothetical protein